MIHNFSPTTYMLNVCRPLALPSSKTFLLTIIILWIALHKYQKIIMDILTGHLEFVRGAWYGFLTFSCFVVEVYCIDEASQKDGEYILPMEASHPTED